MESIISRVVTASGQVGHSDYPGLRIRGESDIRPQLIGGSVRQVGWYNFGDIVRSDEEIKPNVCVLGEVNNSNSTTDKFEKNGTAYMLGDVSIYKSYGGLA